MHNQKKILQLGMRKSLVAFRRQPTFRLQAKVIEFFFPKNVTRQFELLQGLLYNNIAND
jgi:hypothetical protein